HASQMVCHRCAHLNVCGDSRGLQSDRSGNLRGTGVASCRKCSATLRGWSPRGSPDAVKRLRAMWSKWSELLSAQSAAWADGTVGRVLGRTVLRKVLYGPIVMTPMPDDERTFWVSWCVSRRCCPRWRPDSERFAVGGSIGEGFANEA